MTGTSSVPRRSYPCHGDGGGPSSSTSGSTPDENDAHHESNQSEEEEVRNAKAALEFASLIGRLKTTPRTGWVRRGVPRYESVADHSWRVAALSLLLLADQQGRQSTQPPSSSPPAKEAGVNDDWDAATGPDMVDVSRCFQMAIVHDLAESVVGDIAPDDNIDAEEKNRRELEAMALIASGLSRATGCRDSGSHLLELFHEYERRETLEAKCVKDLDLLDMIIQANEYEQTFGIDLSDFFLNTRPSRFQISWLQKIAQEVHNQRSDRCGTASDRNEDDTGLGGRDADSSSTLSSSDAAFVLEFSKASIHDRVAIEQVVQALRGWESRSLQTNGNAPVNYL
jgi:putative hydrolase of HD superfamily